MFIAVEWFLSAAPYRLSPWYNFNTERNGGEWVYFFSRSVGVGRMKVPFDVTSTLEKYSSRSRVYQLEAQIYSTNTITRRDVFKATLIPVWPDIENELIIRF